MSSSKNPLPKLNSSFTVPECEYFRKMCNFTPDERKIFDMRVKDKSTVQICEATGLRESAVYARVRRIKEKIQKVSP